MANLCQVYTGGQAVPGNQVIVGPIQGLASAGSFQVAYVTGSGLVGSYDIEISDTAGDNDWCTIFSRNTPGIALFVLGSPVLFFRALITGTPDPGTVVKVCLVVGDGQRS